MSIAFLIEMCVKRIEYLNSAKAAAMSVGDIAQIDVLDEQLATTQATLTSLRSL